MDPEVQVAVSPQPSEINIGTIGLLPRDKMVVRSGGIECICGVLWMMKARCSSEATPQTAQNQGIHREAIVTDGLAS